jgi:hypothetical protein
MPKEGSRNLPTSKKKNPIYAVTPCNNTPPTATATAIAVATAAAATAAVQYSHHEQNITKHVTNAGQEAGNLPKGTFFIQPVMRQLIP